MKESEFQSWVVQTAESLGWRVWHAATPMRPVGGNKFVPDRRGRGLLDLTMLHASPPRLIMAELKKDDGVVSEDQEEFLRLAYAFAVELDRIREASTLRTAQRSFGVYLWRPVHQELIEATLKSKVLP